MAVYKKPHTAAKEEVGGGDDGEDGLCASASGAGAWDGMRALVHLLMESEWCNG